MKCCRNFSYDNPSKRGHQRARTFPLPHPNRVSNRDHYGHPPHYRSDKFSTVSIFSLNPLENDPSIIYEDPSIENPLCSRDGPQVYIKNVIPFY